MRLADPAWLYALWGVAALAILFVWWDRRARAVVRRFAEAQLLPVVAGRASAGRRILQGSLTLVAASLVFVALARPQWNPQERDVERTGRDVVFLIDVSRSMLARDLAPNRLERTKLWISDLVATLEGDRVALVAFAGAPVIKCPLTLDYAFFRLVLDELTPDSVPRGGTNIGDAIRKTLAEVFSADQADTAHRDIVLITDGEDQESLPIAAAEAAGEAGVRIIAIGLGSSDEGTIITITDDQGRERPLTYAGEPVVSRLDAETLERIAGASAGGVYLDVGTGTIDLEQVYADLIRSAEQTTLGSTRTVRYQEGFQLFLLGAFVLLFMEAFIRDRS